MSNAQKEVLTRICKSISKLSEVDRAYLLGRAEGMAEAAESAKTTEAKKE